jgi:hypothetical protein
MPLFNANQRARFFLRNFAAMNLVQSILLIAIVLTALMFAGLSKPWLLLWWRDTQTRLGVIKLYGSGAALSYFVYWILKLNT